MAKCTYFLLMIVFWYAPHLSTIAKAQSDPPIGYERRYPIDYAIAKRQTGYQEKIFGGREANLAEFPWQVSIRFVDDKISDAVHFCGGALVKDEWVLTATHCFDRAPGPDGSITRAKPKNLIVAAGGVDVNNLPHTAKVLNLIGHKKYRGPFRGHDIALLKLDRPLANGNTITTIKPAPANSVLNHGDGMAVTGWGYTGSDNTIPFKLQVLDNFPAVGMQLCARSLKLDTTIAARLLCGGDISGTRAGCKGDSGSPMVKIANEGPFVVGIISFRPDQSACERPQRYTIATRVSYFEEWLRTNFK